MSIFHNRLESNNLPFAIFQLCYLKQFPRMPYCLLRSFGKYNIFALLFIMTLFFAIFRVMCMFVCVMNHLTLLFSVQWIQQPGLPVFFMILFFALKRVYFCLQFTNYVCKLVFYLSDIFNY